MDRYFYLILCIYLLSIWLIILFLRQDLKKKLVITSIIGGFAGPISEIWYFKDYWRPVSLLPTTIVEDFLFGFLLTGISATIFDFIYRKKIVKKYHKQMKEFIIMFGVNLGALYILNNVLSYNSVIVTSFLFIMSSLYITTRRKDMFLSSFMSGVLLLLLIIPIYFVILKLMPDYLLLHWFLYHTKLGITVFGHIPLTEIIWYFSWGCLGGNLYEFATGKIKT